MRVIFCDNGISHKEVDELFEEEFRAAKAQGLQTSLISFEALKTGEIRQALRFVQAAVQPEAALYRGWMLRPELYQQLFSVLQSKNIHLINTPEQYTFAHHLPENYEAIRDYTPLTTFKPLVGEFRIQDYQEALDIFGAKSIILKDYVKSQKYYWHEACFIPDASDRNHVERVVKRFLDLQGDDLNSGLVFREFVAFQALQKHSGSDLPLTIEFRIFIKNQQIMAVYPYWEEGEYADIQPNVEQFMAVIPRINSNFFTMDVAQKKDGTWMIVELGDGQVSGLPDHANREEFYQKIAL